MSRHSTSPILPGEKDYLHGDQPVQDNELDIVVALLHDEVDVAAGGRLDSRRGRRESDLKRELDASRNEASFFDFSVVKAFWMDKSKRLQK